MGSIITKAIWKKAREGFGLTKTGLAKASIGSALDDYHKAKQKGAVSALKAITDLRAAVEKYKTAPKVVELVTKAETKAKFDGYMDDFLRAIDARTAKIGDYIEIVKDANKLTLDMILKSKALSEAVFTQLKKKYAEENYTCIRDWEKLAGKMDPGKIATAQFGIAMYRKHYRGGNINIFNQGALDKMAGDEETLTDPQKWADFHAELVDAADEVKNNFVDIISKFKTSEEFAEVVAKIKGKDKWMD